MAMLRNDVRRGAARDRADRGRDAARIIGHLLDRENLPRHFLDRAAAVLMARARMRRHAGGVHLEAPDTLARCDDLAAVARRLGDQHIARLLRLRFDQTAQGWAADFRVRAAPLPS